MTQPNSPIVFVHLPKTAGITLWLILQRQYAPEHVCRTESLDEMAALTPAQRQAIQAYVGHFPFGADTVLGTPCTYLTLLRDPVERILSHFAHVVREAQRKPDHVMRGAHADSPADLERYLEIGFGEKDNAQTRALAGLDGAAYTSCSEAVFEIARQHLHERIAVAGVTERFDESLLLMQRRLGWRTPFYGRENIGPNRLPREHFPPSLLAEIARQTEWDQRLYECAKARLRRQIAAEGAPFQQDLRRFQAANTQYQHVRDLFYRHRTLAWKHRLPLDVQRRMERVTRSVFLLTHSRAQPPTGRPG